MVITTSVRCTAYARRPRVRAYNWFAWSTIIPNEIRSDGKSDSSTSHSMHSGAHFRARVDRSHALFDEHDDDLTVAADPDSGRRRLEPYRPGQSAGGVRLESRCFSSSLYSVTRDTPSMRAAAE
jgi:hypothetical protein